MRHLWLACLPLVGCTAVLGIGAPAPLDGDAGLVPDAEMCTALIDTDEANCGDCGDPCSTLHGTPTCTAGECSVACAIGFDDCNDDARTDACETDLGTDPLHCGDCLNPCPTATNANATCAPGGVCGLMCKTGFGNCETSAADCEAVLSSDMANCGACGRSCLAGACSASACLPFDVTTNAFHPGALAFDGTYLYFVRKKPAPPFDLMRVTPDGLSAPEFLVSVTGATQLEVDDTYLYYNESGALRRIEKAPGGTSELIAAIAFHFDMDDAFVYYCSASNMITAWDKTGASAAVPLHMADQNCLHLMVDATRLYWVETDPQQMSTIWAVSKVDGTGLAAFGNTCFVASATQDDTYLYYGARCMPGGPITRIDKSSGFTDDILPMAEAIPQLLVADDSRLHLVVSLAAPSTSEIISYDKTGGDKRILFSGPIGITALINATEAFYWSDEASFKLIGLAK